ncbi:MAG: hypothetical protein Q7L55_05685 [Actinomycetota bacterium]|nr:hypothetical protein [Actinomycetota bacterium]
MNVRRDCVSDFWGSDDLDTDLDPLAVWQQEVDELKFTVDLPLIAEPGAIRAVSARIAKYMAHLAEYRGMVQSISGVAEIEDSHQLRDAIAAIGHELQTSPSQRVDLKIRMDTLCSLVRLELEREHEFIEMLSTHLDAPQINAFSSELQHALASQDHSPQTVIEKGAQHD